MNHYDTIPNRYTATPVYRRYLDSHAKAGELGGKLMHVGRDESRAMVERGEAYWLFQPTIEWPGTLATTR